MKPLLAVAVVTLTSFSWLLPAFAQAPDDAARAAARALYYEGVQSYQTQDYATAAAKLEKAYGLVSVPTLGLASARVLAQLGKLVEASERYRQVTRLELSERDAAAGKLDLEAQRRAQVEAGRELAILAPKIPTLVLEVAGARAAEVRVTVDGLPLPSELVGERLPVNPGVHRVIGQRGAERVENDVSLGEAEAKSSLLRFVEPSPALPAAVVALARSAVTPAAPPVEPSVDVNPQRWRTAGWVAIGGGAGALLIGAVTGLLVLDDKSDIEHRYGKLACPASDHERCDTYNSRRTVSTVGLITGGLLAIGGAAVLLSVQRPTSLALRVELLPLNAGARALVGLEL